MCYRVETDRLFGRLRLEAEVVSAVVAPELEAFFAFLDCLRPTQRTIQLPPVQRPSSISFLRENQSSSI